MRGLLAPIIKLVIFLVVTSFATYVLGATIANSSYGASNTYKANFRDVTGLNLNDDVRAAGVRVGTISDIKLIKGTATRRSYAQVTFSVIKTRPLPRDVEARLRYRNLVGQRYLDIAQGSGDSTAMLSPGGTIPESQTQDAVDLTVLFNGFTNLTQGLDPSQVNKLSYSLIETLQGEAGSLQTLLSTVASLTNTLADKDALIGDVIDNLTTVLQTLDQRDTELTSLIVNLRKLVSGLAGDRTTIGNSLDGINALTTSTAGLLTSVRPPLKKDIVSLNGLISTLNNSSGTLQGVIRDLPTTVGPLIRTASYGSWFNFYLCQASVTLRVGDTGKATDLGPLPFGDQSIAKKRGCA